jgi:hypothetical protein
MPRGLFILASDLPAWRNALEKVAMKKAANRPPQGTPRHGGNGREAFLAKLRCLMRAVQSYPFRKPALQVLSDRSPANAALLHGTPPVPDQLWVGDSATERTSPAALGSAVQKGRHPSGSVRNPAREPLVFGL